MVLRMRIVVISVTPNVGDSERISSIMEPSSASVIILVESSSNANSALLLQKVQKIL